MKLSKNILVTLSILIATSFSALRAQHYIGIQFNGLYGFEPNDLRLFRDVVKLNQSIGYQIFAQYSYKIKDLKLEPKVGIGFKQLNFEGQSVNDLYTGQTSKISLLFGVDYKFYPNWLVGLDLLVDNNLDFEDFRAANSDLLRYSLQLRFGYKIFKRFRITAGYAAALYPRVDHFLIANPSHQVSLGFQYKLFKL